MARVRGGNLLWPLLRWREVTPGITLLRSPVATLHNGPASAEEQEWSLLFFHYNFSSKVKGHNQPAADSLSLLPLFLFLKHPLFPQILLTTSKLFRVYVWKLHHKGELHLWKSVLRWGWNEASASQGYEQPFFLSLETWNCKLPIYIDVRIWTRRYIKLFASLHSNAASEEVNV